MTCFAIVLLLVADRRAHPRLLWVVPVLVAIWANVHGSFFLGPLVLGLAWLRGRRTTSVERSASRPGSSRSLAPLAACLTPFGPMVWAYAVGTLDQLQVTGRITEWQATSTLRDPTGSSSSPRSRRSSSS